MLDNKNEVIEDCREVFRALNRLTRDIGAYSVISSWRSEKGLDLQCDSERLLKFAAGNNLEVKRGVKTLTVTLGEIKLNAYLGNSEVL